MQMSVGFYLIKQLKDIGIDKIFGVQGDFNQELLKILKESQEEMEFIESSNELNASYAADGYAKINSVSALLLNFTAGDLLALNGIVGAYTEDIPMIIISATPPIHALSSRALLHHSLFDGTYNNIVDALSKFTVAQTKLTPQNAASEIPRVLRTCLREKKPVYIQLPSDICRVQLTLLKNEDKIDYSFKSDENMLDLATNFLIYKLKQSQSPIFIFDSLVSRFALSTSLELLVNKLNIPFLTLNSAKGVINENSPFYLGTYKGKDSKKEICTYINNSDCIIEFGARFTDFHLGYFTQNADKLKSIKIYPYFMNSENYSINGVYCGDLIENLLNSNEVKAFEFSRRLENIKVSKNYDKEEKIKESFFWQESFSFLREKDIIVAESGSILQALNKAKLPKFSSFISRIVWASKGYALGATLGASLAAPDRRVLLFIDDEAFKITAQELASLLKLKAKIIIFLLNYQKTEQKKYHNFCKFFAEEGNYVLHEVYTNEDLKQSLAACEEVEKVNFIEIFLEHHLEDEKLEDKEEGKKNYDFHSLEFK